MLRFLDKVRVHATSTLLQLVDQQAAQFFDGHEGYVIGQKASMNYVVFFPNSIYPGQSTDQFPEAQLHFLESMVPPSPKDFVPDRGNIISFPFERHLGELGKASEEAIPTSVGYPVEMGKPSTPIFDGSPQAVEPTPPK